MAEQTGLFLETWNSVRDLILPFVPPALGAYVGIRWSQDLSKNQRVLVWLCAAITGLYVGAGVAEQLEVGPKVTGGIMFLFAMLGQELYAMITAVSRDFVKDPSGSFKRWRDAVLGRNSP